MESEADDRGGYHSDLQNHLVIRGSQKKEGGRSMKNHRIILASCLLTVAAVFILFAGFPKAEAQVVQMKFAHFAEETHPAHLSAKQFAAKVEERTKGQVKIAIYPANVLGSPPEQAEQVKLGAIDMGLPHTGAARQICEGLLCRDASVHL